MWQVHCRYNSGFIAVSLWPKEAPELPLQKGIGSDLVVMRWGGNLQYCLGEELIRRLVWKLHLHFKFTISTFLLRLFDCGISMRGARHQEGSDGNYGGTNVLFFFFLLIYFYFYIFLFFIIFIEVTLVESFLCYFLALPVKWELFFVFQLYRW